MEHLTAWIEAERGRLSKLATFLDITPGAIAQWDKVPAERMGHISQFTGIPMEVLRGDIFERASTPLPAAGAAA
jgi:hypothetical protein